MGGYDLMPEVERILLNAVPVRNAITYRDSIRDEPRTPNRLSLERAGVAGSTLVTERKMSRWEERATIESEAGLRLRPAPNQEGEWLVVWTEVESLYESGPRSRHYTKDIVTGKSSSGMVYMG